jgi:hypothetical protein
VSGGTSGLITNRSNGRTIAGHHRHCCSEPAVKMKMSGIVLAKAHLLARGAFSWVISDSEGLRVYKLYKRHTHPDYSGDDLFDDERNVTAFRSQQAAYTIVQQHKQLIVHTPN